MDAEALAVLYLSSSSRQTQSTLLETSRNLNRPATTSAEYPSPSVRIQSQSASAFETERESLLMKTRGSSNELIQLQFSSRIHDKSFQDLKLGAIGRLLSSLEAIMDHGLKSAWPPP
jgi:hypothetical protein